MKIFPSESVRDIDSYTIKNEPILSIDLMERAAGKLVDWFVRRYRINRKITAFAGPGNNGGDALAIARLLAGRKYHVRVVLVSRSGRFSEDFQINLNRLKEQNKVEIIQPEKVIDLPSLSGDDIVIDGLFGSGLTRKVDGFYGDVIKHINRSSAEVISIDIPSGLFGEDNTNNDPECIIKADYTCSFQFPFLSFLFTENRQYTGEWYVLDIGLHPEAIANTKVKYSLTERIEVAHMIRQRQRFAHKGNFGHVLVVAGSKGMIGAAILSGKAALRSGAGLVTVHLPGSGVNVVHTAVPEIIVSADSSKKYFSMLPDLSSYTAIAAGPGLGKHEKTLSGLCQLLKNASVPLVLDADALNIVSENPGMLELIPEGSVLTPHPGEFDRLAGTSATARERHLKQIELAEKLKVIIILKGAWTGIAFPDGSYKFNSTGNPGMATGGSGDVLTGILVALLAKGLKTNEAAIASVYLHGLAGDLAADKFGQESMIAGDIINMIGEAFIKTKDNPFLHEGRNGGVYQ